MKTVAIDTNALLNFRLKREPYSSEVKVIFARALENKIKIFIPDAVFLECEWVLRSYYKQSKEQITRFFQELLFVDDVVMKDKKEMQLALNLYKNSNGVSFTDCLILHQIYSYQPDDFLTFDENLKKIYKEQ